MKKVIFNGEPGERWANESKRVYYQFEAELRNTCGACLQMHMAISTFWPIPIHRRCRCKQTPIRPGQTAEPFVDFREILDDMPDSQKQAAVGSGLYRLIKRGVVKWDDAVTGSRVRTLEEVVARNKISVQAMTRAGVRRPIAERAWRTVNTPELEVVRAHRKSLVEGLERAGVKREKTIEYAAERIADRIKLGGIDLDGMAGGAAAPVPPKIPPDDLATLLGLDKKAVKAALRKTTKGVAKKVVEAVAPEFPEPKDVKVRFGMWGDEADATAEVVREVLGSDAAETIAAVIGVPDGSRVQVLASRGAKDFMYVVTHPKLKDLRGEFRRLADGALVHRPDFIEVDESARGSGMGSRIHGRWVHWGARLGVRSIRLTAARDSGESDSMNGYLVWPIVGYDGPLPKAVKDKLPDGLKAAATIQELLSLPGGVDWWAEHGETMPMEFDLTPGSRSLDIWRKHWTKKPRKKTD